VWQAGGGLRSSALAHLAKLIPFGPFRPPDLCDFTLPSGLIGREATAEIMARKWPEHDRQSQEAID